MKANVLKTAFLCAVCLVCAGSVSAQPTNDLCADAIPIDVGVPTPGSTSGAAVDPVEFCGTASTSPGVWYYFVGTGNEMTVSTCGAFFDYDTKISVFCADCEELTCIGGNDDNCDGGASDLLSTVTFDTLPGAEYSILVHGFGGAEGDFELTVSDSGTPSTDPIGCPLPPDVGRGAL